MELLLLMGESYIENDEAESNTVRERMKFELSFIDKLRSDIRVAG